MSTVHLDRWVKLVLQEDVPLLRSIYPNAAPTAGGWASGRTSGRSSSRGDQSMSRNQSFANSARSNSSVRTSAAPVVASSTMNQLSVISRQVFNEIITCHFPNSRRHRSSRFPKPTSSSNCSPWRWLMDFIEKDLQCVVHSSQSPRSSEPSRAPRADKPGKVTSTSDQETTTFSDDTAIHKISHNTSSFRQLETDPTSQPSPKAPGAAPSRSEEDWSYKSVDFTTASLVLSCTDPLAQKDASYALTKVRLLAMLSHVPSDGHQASNGDDDANAFRVGLVPLGVAVLVCLACQCSSLEDCFGALEGEIMCIIDTVLKRTLLDDSLVASPTDSFEDKGKDSLHHFLTEEAKFNVPVHPQSLLCESRIRADLGRSAAQRAYARGCSRLLTTACGEEVVNEGFSPMGSSRASPAMSRVGSMMRMPSTSLARTTSSRAPQLSQNLFGIGPYAAAPGSHVVSEVGSGSDSDDDDVEAVLLAATRLKLPSVNLATIQNTLVSSAPTNFTVVAKDRHVANGFLSLAELPSSENNRERGKVDALRRAVPCLVCNLFAPSAAIPCSLWSALADHTVCEMSGSLSTSVEHRELRIAVRVINKLAQLHDTGGLAPSVQSRYGTLVSMGQHFPVRPMMPRRMEPSGISSPRRSDAGGPNSEALTTYPNRWASSRSGAPPTGAARKYLEGEEPTPVREDKKDGNQDEEGCNCCIVQ